MRSVEKAARIACATANTMLSAVQFVLLLMLAQSAVKIYRKFASFLALASMIPLGIAELAFVIFVYAYYYNTPRTPTLLHRTLTVTGAQGLLFTLIVLLRVLIYSPYARAAQRTLIVLLRPLDWVELVGGFVVGLTLILAARTVRADTKRPLEPPVA